MMVGPFPSLRSFASEVAGLGWRALIVDAFEPKERGFALGTHISVIYHRDDGRRRHNRDCSQRGQAIGWRYVFYASSASRQSRFLCRLSRAREQKNLKIKTDWLGAIFFAGRSERIVV